MKFPFIFHFCFPLYHVWQTLHYRSSDNNENGLHSFCLASLGVLQYSLDLIHSQYSSKMEKNKVFSQYLKQNMIWKKHLEQVISPSQGRNTNKHIFALTHTFDNSAFPIHLMDMYWHGVGVFYVCFGVFFVFFSKMKSPQTSALNKKPLHHWQNKAKLFYFLLIPLWKYH